MNNQWSLICSHQRACAKTIPSSCLPWLAVDSGTQLWKKFDWRHWTTAERSLALTLELCGQGRAGRSWLGRRWSLWSASIYPECCQTLTLAEVPLMALPMLSGVGVALDTSNFVMIPTPRKIRATAAHVFSRRNKGLGCDLWVAKGTHWMDSDDHAWQRLSNPSFFSFLFFSFLSFHLVPPITISIRAGQRVHKPSLEFPQTEGTARDRPMSMRWSHAYERLAMSLDSTGSTFGMTSDPQPFMRRVRNLSGFQTPDCSLVRWKKILTVEDGVLL